MQGCIQGVGRGETEPSRAQGQQQLSDGEIRKRGPRAEPKLL